MGDPNYDLRVELPLTCLSTGPGVQAGSKKKMEQGGAGTRIEADCQLADAVCLCLLRAGCVASSLATMCGSLGHDLATRIRSGERSSWSQI